MTEVTGKMTKLAWIHDGPPGVASLGHFNCPCGNRISDVEYGGPDVTCGKCGKVWDGRGWLVSEPSLHELRMQAVREHSPAVQDGPYAYFDRDKS